MGLMRVETESGSVYFIDEDYKLWHRQQGQGASAIRSGSGEYISVDYKIGECLVLLCPPIGLEDDFGPWPSYRSIISTPIVSIREIVRSI